MLLYAVIFLNGNKKPVAAELLETIEELQNTSQRNRVPRIWQFSSATEIHSKILRKRSYYDTFLATPVGSGPFVYNEKIVFPFLQFQFSINSSPENSRARRHM